MEVKKIADEILVHPFEKAGLGLAPFALKGVRENVYSACPGHSQPGGTCDYCGTGIRWEFVIQSADNKQFVVGSDCVRKSGDAKLIPLVESEERKRKRESAALARKLRTAALVEKIKAHSDLDKWKHPNLFFASQGKTLLDYVNFCLTPYISESGAKAILRMIEMVKATKPRIIG